MTLASLRAFVGAALVASTLVAPSSGQNVHPSHDLAYVYDSGARSNAGTAPEVVLSHTIHVSGAPWMRLFFRHVELAGDPADGTGSILRITSFADGAVQELNAEHVRQWRNSSAYFNGDTLQIEVLAQPGTGDNRVITRSVNVGDTPMFPVTQCGPADDRVLSNDPRVARMMPITCTGWMFDDCGHCFGTAGHCAGSSLQVAQFQVPLSNANGTLNHPGPEDQYSVDVSSKQSVSAGIGDDWGYYGVFPNSNTGLHPIEAQGDAFVLSADVPPNGLGAVIRITGHGSDSTPASHDNVQQTHAGPMFSSSSTTMRYQTDTTGGSSGSPVIWDNGGGLVVGVHSHGGCSNPTGTSSNAGTSVTHPGWAAARANPQGVCDPTGSATTYCTAKVNSQGCLPAIGTTGTPTLAGGAGSFSVTATMVLNQKNGLLFYGFRPNAGSFQGGTLCVGAPTKRTPIQGSGGSAAGDDCTGTFSFDMGARIAAGVDPALSTCGAIVYAQYWSRDPADPFTTNLTDGVRFVVGE